MPTPTPTRWSPFALGMRRPCIHTSVWVLIAVCLSFSFTVGCSFDLAYKGQPDDGDLNAEFGKVSCGESAVALLAIDGVKVEYPEFGPLSFRDAGFAVRVEPGLHVLKLQYEPANPDAGGINEPKRLNYGPPQILTVVVPAGREVKLKAVERGGISWEVVVMESKSVD